MKATKKNLEKLDLLKGLKRLSESERKTFLRLLGDQSIDILCEVIANLIFNSDKKISKRLRKQLCKTFKHKKSDVNKISKKNIDVNIRRKLLNKSQIGGNLGVILSAGIPLLSNLLFGHS